jgi:hypothetical protein
MIKHKEMYASIDGNLALTVFIELWPYDYLTFRGGEKSTQGMWCLVSPIHDALKLLIKFIEHSIIESNQWVIMGPHK